MEFHLIKIAHLRHCIEYKKIVFRCIFSSLPFPEELEKYLFPFIGVFPLFYALSYTAIEPEPEHVSRSLLLREHELDSLPSRGDALVTFVS